MKEEVQLTMDETLKPGGFEPRAEEVAVEPIHTADAHFMSFKMYPGHSSRHIGDRGDGISTRTEVVLE